MILRRKQNIFVFFSCGAVANRLFPHFSLQICIACAFQIPLQNIGRSTLCLLLGDNARLFFSLACGHKWDLNTCVLELFMND